MKGKLVGVMVIVICSVVVSGCLNPTKELNLNLGGLAGKGGVEITSQPKGAKVYINEDYQGRTPLRLYLPPGEYYVKVQKSGYLNDYKWITISRGKKVQVNFTLKEE